MRLIAALIVGSVLVGAGCAGSMMGDKEIRR